MEKQNKSIFKTIIKWLGITTLVISVTYIYFILRYLL